MNAGPRRRGPLRWFSPAVIAVLFAVGCHLSEAGAAAPGGGEVGAATRAVAALAAGARPRPATAIAGAAPAFSAHVDRVTAQTVPYTWRTGCPVGPPGLRLLSVGYWGFDGIAHTGRIVVNESVVSDVIDVFRALYDERFPIWEMVPEDAYHGNDNAAAAADDTSGFNCRYAVAPGPPRWSVHAYGEAIDVNDVQNPYIDGTTVIPPAGRAYLDREDIRPGMAVPGGELVRAFASVGWFWGGRWSASPDYQHFSLTGG